MSKLIRLCANQRAIMKEFYAHAPLRVIFTKKERECLWNAVKAGQLSRTDLQIIYKLCPALHHQIVQHDEDGANVQSAVFSECVYAQTLANLFGLSSFHNCLTEGNSYIPEEVLDILHSYTLHPRYVYSRADKSRMLIQAGGCAGVDSALITMIGLTVYTIEFKEPGAKSSEPDLPKYGEDGKIPESAIEEFLERYPQFSQMMNEHRTLNFFAEMGHNINDFSAESVNAAVTNNYSYKKFADVICTEDRKGRLVMLPINHVSQWATIEGEIRPSGRNNYAVWTPLALLQALVKIGAKAEGETISVKLDRFHGPRYERGGSLLSGYKINPLFFIRKEKCIQRGNNVYFMFSDVRQLKPTITAKIFFKNLDYVEVRQHYASELN